MAAREGREALAQILVANDGEVLQRLRLSAAEAARVCSVTPRQLIYWTKKGLVRSASGDDRDYDIFAMEKVIRIRKALEKGYSLEKAAQLVQKDLAALNTEVQRLEAMATDELEAELRRRLESLEERIAHLRRTIPASLGLARLQRAVVALSRLDSPALVGSAESDGGKSAVLRLGRAVDELESLLREVQPAAT